MSHNKQRNQKIVSELASQPGNNICADCKARGPRWASHNLGIFICVNCASIHRKIGTHITKVKSLTMDDWTKEQVENMKSIGNVNSNRIYNPNEIRNPPPPNLEESERDSEIEQYIRAKYEDRKFFDKSALVASKLGNPRSASSSATLPQSVSSPRSSAHTTKPHVAAPTTSTSLYTAPPPKPFEMVPRVQPPQPQPPQPPQPSGGIWEDMNSLKGNNNSQNSSLPLQYQTTYPPQGSSTQLPAVNGTIDANNCYFVGVPTSGMGLNSYQSDQVRKNPFSKQQSRPSFPPSSITSTFSTPTFPPSSTTSTFPTALTMNSQPFGEQLYGVSQSSASIPVAPYYNPQPPTSMQIRNPSGQSFISEAPNQRFPSTQPTGQSQFPPQRHNSIPQPQYNGPQLMPTSPNPQYIYQGPGPAQPQQMGGGPNVSSQSQFLGMTSMQMQQQQQQMQMQQQQQHQQQMQQQQQQQMQQQQQQMQHQHQPQQLGQNYYPSMQPQMMSHQASSTYNQTSIYPPQGGYPPQTGGGQWNTRM